jgi:tetratricopeptide (TPR) repeat protein
MNKNSSLLIETGVSHFNAGRFEQASRCFESALRRNASNAAAREFLLQSCFESTRFALDEGRLDDALASFQKAARLKPSAARLHKPFGETCIRLGQALLRGVRLREAQQVFDGAGFSDAPALMSQVKANLLLNRFDRAFAYCEEILDKGRDQEILELLLFPFAEVPEKELRSRPKMAEDLARYARNHPKSYWPTLVRASLFHNLYDQRLVLKELERFEKIPRRYGWMDFLRGKLLLHITSTYDSRPDYETIDASFARAFQAAPRLMMAKAYTAETALCRGRAREAFTTMTGLIEQFKGRTRADARAWRGDMYLWVGEYKKAFSDLDAAVGEGARFAQGWRGAAHLMLGRPQEALADLDASLASRPNDQEITTWRAEARYRLGLREQALQDLDAALRMPRGSPWALAGRGLHDLEAGFMSRARADRDAMPLPVLQVFHKAAGVPLQDELSAAELKRVFEAALHLARGLRRTDIYLFPIWAKR